MTELHELRQLWTETSEVTPSRPLRAEELMHLIEARQESVRKRAQRRLRWEVWNYLPSMVIILTTIFLKNGARKGLIGTAVFAGLLSVVFVTLLYKERQMSRAPMAGSLKESLGGLLAMLDSTSRAYLAAYMALIVAALVMMAGVAIWKLGARFLTLVVLSACVAGALWAFRSGQAYLEGMFGKYRRELTECLKEIEEV